MAGEVQTLGGEQLVGAVVLERRPLELEEDQPRLDGGPLLLHAREQGAARRVGRVRREVQHGVGADAADDLREPGELAHRLDQAGAVELGDAAGVALGERVGAALGVGEHGVDGGLAGAVEQRGEIPGDLLDLGVGQLRGAHDGLSLGPVRIATR